jgi:hypothetical protein
LAGVSSARRDRSIRPVAVFLGHHKCATSWINAIAEDVSRRLGLKFAIVSSHREFNEDLPGFIDQNEIDLLSYSNAKIEHISALTHYRAFHIIRDPRDIIVSAYHSHFYSHSTARWPKLASHREKLKSVSKDEGLWLEMGFSRWELEDLDKWNYHLPDVMEIKMEELIVNPYDRLLEAFTFLGLAENGARSARSELLAASANWIRGATGGTVASWLRPDKLSTPEFLGIIHKNRFAAKAGGRRPGDEDVTSHYRKGVAGDWVNHFSPDNRQYFKSNFGELLLKLGYEKSLDW